MDYDAEIARILAEVLALHEELLRVKLSQRFENSDRLPEIGWGRMIENAVGLTERQAREQVNVWLAEQAEIGLTLEVANGQVAIIRAVDEEADE